MGARKQYDANDVGGGGGGCGGGGGNGNGNDSEYVSKRARNNEAVKRSREKARHKAKDTSERVNKLKSENEMLEERIKLLSKELTFLKDIFLAHAG
jgi:CCAAT/enhancer binding protein (C/EBP) gamma